DAHRGLPPFVHVADAADGSDEAGLLEDLAPGGVEHAGVFRLEAAPGRYPPVALGAGGSMPDEQNTPCLEDQPGGADAVDHGGSRFLGLPQYQPPGGADQVFSRSLLKAPATLPNPRNAVPALSAKPGASDVLLSGGYGRCREIPAEFPRCAPGRGPRER